ncbi:MAG: pilus assembly protein [Lachnospiraceae bacterium]|nr:pilus assembly protein [Lachnospiraceae bacterium]
MKTNKDARASITVEAALVCPIFLFAMLALINIVIWFGEAEDVQRKLAADLGKVRAVSYMSENILPLRDKDGDIDLMNMYVACDNVPIPEFIRPIVRQHVVSRPFSGITSIEDAQRDEIVYITPNGRVYHESCTCSYIKTVVYTVRLSGIDGERNDSGGKYYPCERCGKDVDGKMVYVTSYGNRYHGNKECSSIRRNVISVFREELDGMRMCKKCGGN